MYDLRFIGIEQRVGVLFIFSEISHFMLNKSSNKNAIIQLTHVYKFIILTTVCDISSMSRSYFMCVNSSPPGHNDRRFADDIFRWIFVNEKFCILIKISLKFVPKRPIDNYPALV